MKKTDLPRNESWTKYLLLSLTLISSSLTALGQPTLSLTELPEGGGVLLSWDIGGPNSSSAKVYQLQRSKDLNQWENVHEIDLRPNAIPLPANEFIDPNPGPVCFYRLTTGGAVVATAASGADLYGFSEQFKKALESIGQISVEDFVTRYDQSGRYVEELSYDPTDAEFWDTLDTPPGEPEPNSPRPNPQDVRLDDFGLNEEETAVFRKNGFVVSGRKGDHSFADSYYKIFTNDLPVFVSLDSFLHAWHQNYMAMLAEQEENILSFEFLSILEASRNQLQELSQVISDELIPSLHDADFYLTVAISLFKGSTEKSALGHSDALVQSALSNIQALSPTAFPIFGRSDSGVFDFSQFKPRGHYTRSEELTRYFRAAMWCGRVDLRVAGPKDLSSPRELGTAIILQEALVKAQKLEAWEQFDKVIQAFVGLSDSMTAPQLKGVLDSSGIKSLEEISSLKELEELQAAIEVGELGAQEIFSHGFFTSGSGPALSLPRSFTLFGQRFVMDSWAMSNLVFDRIFWNDEKISRRLPSGVDIAFTVFGNRSATDLLRDRITNPAGVPFRDGYPIQHHLGALADMFDQVPTDRWENNVYTSWLHTLRQWSQPLDDSIPEVFRTREWARKTMSSQLASWAELRHNTVLYAKQSASGGVFCSFPFSYIEPNLPVWISLSNMAGKMADLIESFELKAERPPLPPLPDWVDPDNFPNVPLETLQRWFAPPSFQRDPQLIINRQVEALRQFQSTCDKLVDIVEKQNSEIELDESQKRFLKDMVEIMVDYVGVRTYSGWYTRLYYTALGTSGDIHPADLWDPIVTDVHTDFPDTQSGDPGTILHQGVGNTAMMVISIDCDGRRVYTGPVYTYYEFTSGPGVFDRMTDEEWKERLLSGEPPAEPEWTSGHRFPGKVQIPFFAR